MASNPMQKKSRNSFLLGMLLMLIIAAVAMAAMFFLLKKDEKKQEEQASAQKNVYVVKNTIASGKEITQDDLQLIAVNADTIPSNAYGSGNFYDSEDGTEKGLYYYIKNNDGEDEAVPRYRAKITLTKGTVLNTNMMYEGEKLNASVRIQEYNMLQLPVQLEPGEYVDVRLQMPNGQDYIIVSHKEVKDIIGDTIWLQLAEEEILLMSNAMVESYIAPASNIYVTKYVEPGMQTAAAITYVPSHEVAYLIQQDSNIVEEAKDMLTKRYANESALRNNMQTELDKYSDQAIDNIQKQMEEAREKAKQAREEFLYGVN